MTVEMKDPARSDLAATLAHFEELRDVAGPHLLAELAGNLARAARMVVAVPVDNENRSTVTVALPMEVAIDYATGAFSIDDHNAVAEACRAALPPGDCPECDGTGSYCGSLRSSRACSTCPQRTMRRGASGDHPTSPGPPVVRPQETKP